MYQTVCPAIRACLFANKVGQRYPGWYYFFDCSYYPPIVYNLPAGHVDKGEQLEEAAVREAKEETGYDVRLIEHFALYNDSYNFLYCGEPKKKP